MRQPLFTDIELSRVDYNAIVDTATDAERTDMKAYLFGVLPQEWIYAYADVSPQQHNIHEISIKDCDYLLDFSDELVRQGKVSNTKYVDDRLVAAHGFSKRNNASRNDSRLSGYSLGPAGFIDDKEASKFDRGHAIAHSIGGALDLNIIPQLRSMNRGREWRKMERYCLHNPGTYFFCRPLYIGYSRHAAEIEFGILRPDGSLWVQTFRNYKDINELEEIEIAYLKKIAINE
jgi:hypothetical protein